jgi:arylsulfatase A-like enzyme/Flp pilus assembly protein TadD
MRRRVLTLVVPVVVGVAAAIAWSARPAPGPRGEPGLSVLLVTVDTLRADAIGAYGHRQAETPWMDRLAAGGVRFDVAYAHNVVTLPSHANILSGRHPLDHGVRDNAGFVFPADIDTLATLLKARGYRTAAFISAFPLAARFGLGRGFDLYEDRFVDATPRPAFRVQERPGPETVALARAWLDAAPGQPSFCWVHLYEPHYPYRPPEPLASRFRDRPYDGEVAAADAALGPLLEAILAAGAQGRTLVVLTSDHGESLGDHGEATHGVFAYEPALRVPLVLYQPRLLAPRVTSGPVAHVDVLPTILDALAVPIPGGLAGRSLLAEAAGRAAGEATIYFEAISASLDRGWAPLHGVVHGRRKYIDLPIPELYDLARDPREAQNLIASEPRLAGDLLARLQSFRARDRGTRRTDPGVDTQERLRSLGYLAGASDRSKPRYTEDDDPKRLIGLDTMLQDVLAHYLDGDLEGALARGHDLVGRRPDMAVSLLVVAHLERERGNIAAGIETLKRAWALNPDDSETASLLGAYLTEANRAREAADVLERHASREPPDVQALVVRALALARLGRTADALASLDRALAVEPSNAMILVHAGTVALMAGDRDGARRRFVAALETNPRVARAESSLGMMAAEEGRDADALDHWRRAVALDPREHAKLLPLAGLLDGAGRPAAARPYLELFVASAPPALFARDIARVRARLGPRRGPDPRTAVGRPREPLR